MNLRLRLIVAFFLLSVVPLGAVTLYTYTSNAKALQDAARHEAELLAGELTQRMQVITAELSERVEHLMDISAEPATATTAPAAGQSATAAAANADKVAATLGDVAMLLNNIELRGMRGPGPGRQGRPGGPGGPGPGGGQEFNGGRPGGPGANELGGERGNGAEPGSRFGRGGFGARAAGGAPPSAATAESGAVGAPPSSSGATPPPEGETNASPSAGRGPSPFSGLGAPHEHHLPPPPESSSGPASTAGPSGNPAMAGNGTPSTPPGAVPDNGIQIDLTPIRRELFRQLVPEGQTEHLTPEEWQRIAAEVNQRMLGIAQGIQMGAAEAQKKVNQAAQQAADEKAREIQAAKRAEATARSTAAASTAAAPASSAAPAAPATGAAAPVQRKAALSGTHLDVSMVQNGQVVHQVNAEVNLQNLLLTVFAATRRDRGEVPFAVGKDGPLYTPTDDDRKTLEAIGGAPLKPETPPGTAMIGDWVVVTTADPTGSGLKLGIARPVGDSLNNLRRTTVRNAGFGLAFIVIAIVGIVPVATRLTRNLSRLSDAVHRIAQGDYRARVDVRSHDEVGRLAQAFNQMAEDVERHQRAVVLQERTKRELELGRQIQQDMLPQAPLRLGPIEIEGVSVPAREVGGDFFNYFVLPDGRIALLVGDVSGKGVGAALLMANIQASLRTRLALGQDLAALGNEIDRDLEASTPGPVYATLFIGILDPATRTLRYINAGHYPQYVLRRHDGLERMSATGLPVGLLAGRGYIERQVSLAAGDQLFFYTDGCVDNESPTDEMFGMDRLEAVLTTAAKEGATDVLARLEAAASEFRRNREPFDDTTMMVVKIG